MSTFYNDFLKKDPRFYSENRIYDVQLLHPVLRRKVLAILKDAQAADKPMMMFETYRSQQRQEKLFQEGATKLQHVGLHHFGLACDIVFKDSKGNPTWSGDYGFLGHLARSHNLVWGGDWPHFKDMDHVQLIPVVAQNDVFNGHWYPDDQWEIGKMYETLRVQGL